MKSRFLLATFLLSITAAAADRWASPDKFYSVAPPETWTYREDAPGGHRSFAWISPDQKAEIRISATYNLVRLPKELPDEIVDAFFPNERGVTPMQKVSGAGWDGLRREYTNSDKSTRWLAVSARNETTVVALTMSAPSSDFEHFRAAFDSVWHSLMLGGKTSSIQAMQRTAGRSAFPLSMTSTFNPQPRSPSPAVADLVSR